MFMKFSTGFINFFKLRRNDLERGQESEILLTPNDTLTWTIDSLTAYVPPCVLVLKNEFSREIKLMLVVEKYQTVKFRDLMHKIKNQQTTFIAWNEVKERIETKWSELAQLVSNLESDTLLNQK